MGACHRCAGQDRLIGFGKYAFLNYHLNYRLRDHKRRFTIRKTDDNHFVFLYTLKLKVIYCKKKFR